MKTPFMITCALNFSLVSFSQAKIQPDTSNGYVRWTVPPGKQHHITWPNGTQIWLNNESSVWYPLNSSDPLDLEIKGEGYLELPEGDSLVLRIHQHEGNYHELTIHATGAQFHVTAYEDEETITTSVFKGQISLETGIAFHDTLMAGQQAFTIKRRTGIRNMSEGERDELLAWMKGLFVFHCAHFSEVLRCYARWYNFQLEIEGNPNLNHLYDALLSNKTPVSHQLEMLEWKLDDVHFYLDGSKVIVTK